MSDEIVKALLASSNQEILQQALEKIKKGGLQRNLSLTNSEKVDLLNRRFTSLFEKNEFTTGQIVKWKDGLKNKNRPAVDEPAIVIDILEEPIYDNENGAGSPYFREPLDLLLGILDEDGDFVIFYYDKRRFEPLK